MTHTDTDGRVWYTYEARYRSPDGTFAFQITATDDDHAQWLLQDLKESAILSGRVYEFKKT